MTADDRDHAEPAHGPVPPGEEPPLSSLRARFARRFRWLRFLKPGNPAEALALVALGAALGTGATKAYDAILKADPWYERADEVCLKRGDEYLNVTGSRTERLARRLAITQAALRDLQDVRSSVPPHSQLSYGSFIGEKKGQIDAMKARLVLARRGRATTKRVSKQVSGAEQAYQFAASELDLSVCGQGTGKQ